MSDKPLIETLEFISTNKDGNFYFGYRVSAPRSINPKARRKEDELLIVGVPKAHLKDYLRILLKEETK